MWVFYSILSALSESLRDVTAKKSVVAMGSFASAIGLHASALLFVLPFLAVDGFPQLKVDFWLGTGIFVFITPIWTVLYMHAVNGDLSRVMPLMAFNPIFTAMLEYFFGGEILSSVGLGGIGLIFAGAYFIYLPKWSANFFLKPIKALFHDSHSISMLGVALLWSLGAHASRIRVLGSSPLMSTFAGGLTGLVTVYFTYRFILRKSLHITTFSNSKSVWLIGICYMTANVLAGYALQTASATYVFSIKRGSILLSSLFGIAIFKERLENTKMIGLAMLFIGLILLTLSR